MFFFLLKQGSLLCIDLNSFHVECCVLLKRKNTVTIAWQSLHHKSNMFAQNQTVVCRFWLLTCAGCQCTTHHFWDPTRQRQQTHQYISGLCYVVRPIDGNWVAKEVNNKTTEWNSQRKIKGGSYNKKARYYWLHVDVRVGAVCSNHWTRWKKACGCVGPDNGHRHCNRWRCDARIRVRHKGNQELGCVCRGNKQRKLN